MMSPHDIKVLLHHHCVVGPWPLGETTAYIDSRSWMEASGILHQNGTMWETTERGNALVQMLCATPLPDQAFVDPRTGKVVDHG